MGTWGNSQHMPDYAVYCSITCVLFWYHAACAAVRPDGDVLFSMGRPHISGTSKQSCFFFQQMFQIRPYLEIASKVKDGAVKPVSHWF